MMDGEYKYITNKTISNV